MRMFFRNFFNTSSPKKDMPTQEEKDPCSTVKKVILDCVTDSYYTDKPDRQKEHVHEIVFDRRGARSSLVPGSFPAFKQCLGFGNTFNSKLAGEVEADILEQLLPKPGKSK